MPHHTEEFDIQAPLASVVLACRQVVAELGWKISEQGDTRLIVKESLLRVSAVATFAAHVEILMAASAPATTHVTLVGSIFGMGPLQSSHLRERVENLRNRIELVASQHAGASITTTPGQGQVPASVPAVDVQEVPPTPVVSAQEAPVVAPASSASSAPAPTAASTLADDIARLSALHAEGALSDEEFAQAKARLLNP